VIRKRWSGVRRIALGDGERTGSEVRDGAREPRTRRRAEDPGVVRNKAGDLRLALSVRNAHH